jgi:UDP-N-acetylmuramate dehydrogenase
VNVPLKEHNILGVGGNADFFVTMNETKEFARLLTAASENGLKVAVIGSGTNCVFSDHGFRGLVIKNELTEFDLSVSALRVGSGLAMTDVIHRLADEGCGGFEELASLPGTVGGAVASNAGVTPHEIKGALLSVTLFSKGSVVEVEPSDMQFEYRDSRVKHTGEQVLGATFRVAKKDPHDIKRLILSATQARLRSRPGAEQAIPVFRDPLPDSVADLVSQVDMPGERIGGAMVSTKDPNYIINEGSATAAEVYELAQRVKHRVSVKLGKKLVEQIDWLGEW